MSDRPMSTETERDEVPRWAADQARQMTPVGLVRTLVMESTMDEVRHASRQEILRRLRSDPEPDGEREAGPSRHELAGALASVLSSAGFVEPMHDGTGWWECRACEAQGEGPGEIEHLPECPEAVEQRYREALPDPQVSDTEADR